MKYVDELYEKKRTLDKTIDKLIKDFTNETGLSVDWVTTPEYETTVDTVGNRIIVYKGDFKTEARLI